MSGVGITRLSIAFSLVLLGGVAWQTMTRSNVPCVEGGAFPGYGALALASAYPVILLRVRRNDFAYRATVARGLGLAVVWSVVNIGGAVFFVWQARNSGPRTAVPGLDVLLWSLHAVVQAVVCGVAFGALRETGQNRWTAVTGPAKRAGVAVACVVLLYVFFRAGIARVTC